MNTQKGSSETTREASVFHLHKFYNAYKATLLNSKPPSASFLEWFIGFTEGDGSFSFTALDKKRNKRPKFVINQKEFKVLHYIKTALGFGQVTDVSDKKKNQKCFRYTVNKLEFITVLMALFDENLILKKTDLRFLEWVKAYNQLCYARADLKHLKYYDQIEPSRSNSSFTKGLKKLNLESAWLSGFTDAEGGFYAAWLDKKSRPSKTGAVKTYKRLVFKFYLKQKGEFEVLEKIAQCLKPYLKDTQGSTGVTLLRSKKDTYVLEFSSKADLDCVQAYFAEYKLLSRNKSISYERWVRVRNRNIPSEKDKKSKKYRRFVRLVKAVGTKCNEKIKTD